MLVVMDGTDGAGKSTQLELLQQELAKTRAVSMYSHPAYTGFGKFLRKHLYDESQRYSATVETFLYAADFAESCGKIAADLADGRTCLVHRWWYSAIVYQHWLDGADRRLVEEVSRLAMRLEHHEVDHAVFLLASPETSAARLQSRAELVGPYEEVESLKNAYTGFASLSQRSPYYLGARRVHVFHTDEQSVQDTHLQILAALGIQSDDQKAEE